MRKGWCLALGFVGAAGAGAGACGGDGGATATTTQPDASTTPDAATEPATDSSAPSEAGPSDAAPSEAAVDANGDAGPPRLLLGANIHVGGGDATANQALTALLQARHLRTVRMDFGTGQDATPWRDQVQRLQAAGIRAETTLFPTYQFDTSCTLDLATTQADAYAQTTTMVNAIKDLVTDYELMNEVSLRAELQAEVPTNSQAPASAYAGKPCYAVKAAVLKGMFQAIRDVAKQSGLPLRVLAGTVGRDWGYLDFLRQQGIDFDVVGYHIYPSFNQAAWDTDPWFGPSGLFAELAKYDRPVHVNEFDCGEIYQASFENQAGGALTEACFKSIPKYMFEILNQTRVRIESVHFYEMFDETTKTAPENHFGLWYTPTTPKVSAYLASAFAGGALSASEENELTSRGLLTAAQIAGFK
jgi:hypothetical protein